MKKWYIIAFALGAFSLAYAAKTDEKCHDKKPSDECLAWEHKEDGYLVRQCTGPCTVVAEGWGKRSVCTTEGTNVCTAKIKIP